MHCVLNVLHTLCTYCTCCVFVLHVLRKHVSLWAKPASLSLCRRLPVVLRIFAMPCVSDVASRLHDVSVYVVFFVCLSVDDFMLCVIIVAYVCSRMVSFLAGSVSPGLDENVSSRVKSLCALVCACARRCRRRRLEC